MMGGVYNLLDRHAEALEAYEEALRIQRAALGDDHPDVAATLDDIEQALRAARARGGAK